MNEVGANQLHESFSTNNHIDLKETTIYRIRDSADFSEHRFSKAPELSYFDRPVTPAEEMQRVTNRLPICKVSLNHSISTHRRVAQAHPIGIYQKPDVRRVSGHQLHQEQHGP